MNALAKNDETTPSVAMRLLVDQHGVWAVLRGLMAALLRRGRKNPARRVVGLDDLSPHLRRDMGLPPLESPRKYWDLR